MAARAGISGLIIADVLPGSAAQKAGLRGLDGQRLGDVITHVDGTRIHTLAELAAAATRYGDRVG